MAEDDATLPMRWTSVDDPSVEDSDDMNLTRAGLWRGGEMVDCAAVDDGCARTAGVPKFNCRCSGDAPYDTGNGETLFATDDGVCVACRMDTGGGGDVALLVAFSSPVVAVVVGGALF